LEVRHILHFDPDLFADLADDALLERFAGLDEPRQAAVERAAELPPVGKQRLFVVLAPGDQRDGRWRKPGELHQRAFGTDATALLGRVKLGLAAALAAEAMRTVP